MTEQQDTTSTSMKAEKSKGPFLLGVLAVGIVVGLFIVFPNGEPKVSTADWNTYSHPFLGYSLKHPNSWFQFPNEGNLTALAYGTSENIFTDETANEIIAGEGYIVVDAGPVTIEQYKASLEVNEAQFNANLANNPDLKDLVSLKTTTKDVVTDAGHPAFRVETVFTNESNELPAGMRSVSYLFERGDISFNLVFWSSDVITEQTKVHLAQFEAFVNNFDFVGDVTLDDITNALQSISSTTVDVGEGVVEVQ